MTDASSPSSTLLPACGTARIQRVASTRHCATPSPGGVFVFRMKKPHLGILVVVIAALLLGVTGCANFHTTQSDRTTSTNGVTREITTRASARAFAAGKGSLDGWRASQTDKSQTASLSGVQGESDAQPLAQTMGALLIQGLSTYMTGGAAAARPATGAPVGAAASGSEYVTRDDLRALLLELRTNAAPTVLKPPTAAAAPSSSAAAKPSSTAP